MSELQDWKSRTRVIGVALVPQFGRDVLRGIAAFAHEQVTPSRQAGDEGGRWELQLLPPTNDSNQQALYEAAEPDAFAGLIVHGDRARSLLRRSGQSLPPADRLLKRLLCRANQVPTVAVAYPVEGRHDIPLVMTDEDALAATAMDHFAGRGFRRCCFITGVAAPPMRGAAFERASSAWDIEAVTPLPTSTVLKAASPAGRRHDRSRDQAIDALRAWYERASDGRRRPVGAMCYNDSIGRHLAVAARHAGIPVPDGLAILGVDNDEAFCELTDPPLTSVPLNQRRVGQVAGRQLCEQLDRASAHGEGTASAVEEDVTLVEGDVTLVPPLPVVTRRSTDVLAVDDPDFVKVLRHLRERACVADADLRVPTLARQFLISGPSLHRLFRRHLGRTLGQEIARLRVERAKRLLVEGDLTPSDVARTSGFRSARQFYAVFTQALGEPPAAYRRRNRTSTVT